VRLSNEHDYLAWSACTSLLLGWILGYAWHDGTFESVLGLCMNVLWAVWALFWTTIIWLHSLSWISPKIFIWEIFLMLGEFGIMYCCRKPLFSRLKRKCEEKPHSWKTFMALSLLKNVLHQIKHSLSSNSWDVKPSNRKGMFGWQLFFKYF